MNQRDHGERKAQLQSDTMYVAPFKAPAVLVDTAPETSKHLSKRLGGIKALSGELDVKRGLLEEQALEKERIFKRNVANLRTRVARFRTRVSEEVAARAEMHDELSTAVETLLAERVKLVEDELEAATAVIEEDWLPPPGARLDEWADSFDRFVNVTVPETIENQSGRVTRHLIKAQETFEIDNAKLLRRENKINERYREHVAATRENMRQVQRKRKDCFVLLEEDMNREERLSDRAEEQHLARGSARLLEVRDMQDGLAGVRAETDSEILVGIERTMQRLQKSVLDNFGVQAAYR